VDDESAVLEVREVSLDERLALAKQAATRRGDVVDLTREAPPLDVPPRPGAPGYRQRQRLFFANAWHRWTATDPSHRVPPPAGRPRWFAVCGVWWTDDERLQLQLDAEEACAFIGEHQDDKGLPLAADDARALVLAELDAEEIEGMAELQRTPSRVVDRTVDDVAFAEEHLQAD
jgi:hypothetical protein